jgi:hypothetical protein
MPFFVVCCQTDRIQIDMAKRSFFLQSLTANLRWLSLGMGIKRWLLLLGLGAAIAGMGLVYLILMLDRVGWLPQTVYDTLTLQFLPLWGRILLPLVLGVVIM